VAEPRIAIVHEWLTTYAGSERVLKHLLQIFPNADLWVVADFLPQAQRAFLAGRRVQTTVAQHWPLARRWLRLYLPLLPLAVEQLDLSGYDLIISSHHAVAKGVLTGPDQVHLAYVHSPMRYAWDLQEEYLRQSGLGWGIGGWLTRWLLHQLRQWDRSSSLGVDLFVANSQFIARRIAKAYRRSATVVYPPVDTEHFTLGGDRQDFYLTASRLVPYKRVELIAEAFLGMPDRQLVVIGDGVGRERLCRLVGAAPNIQVLGYQPPEVLKTYLQRARAFVFAAEEDFGIVMVEAQACGTPVIAYGRGGAAEILQTEPKPTGVLFTEQTVDSIQRAVKDFEALSIDPLDCRRNAERFGIVRFQAEIRELVTTLLLEGCHGRMRSPVKN
jgi:glycosyltransferase involved in cell wall biosynthesis